MGSQNEEDDANGKQQQEVLPEAKKLNLSNFLQSNAEVTVEKETPKSVGKLNVSALISGESTEEHESARVKKVEVKKLDTNEIFQKNDRKRFKHKPGNDHGNSQSGKN